MTKMFETERLIIRAFRDEDARELYENHLDDEVRKWFPNECYADLAEAQTASQRENEIAVLNREVARTVADISALTDGKRMLVPKDRLIQWIEAKVHTEVCA